MTDGMPPGQSGLRVRIAAQRAQRIAASLQRVRRTVLRRDGVHCELDDGHGGVRRLLNFCSNDYLGLSQQNGASADDGHEQGRGGVASHLVCGHHLLHDQLERAIADWQQAPAALLFGNGYLANLAVIQSLLGNGDTCVQDKLNHASLIDGARLSGARLRRYRHADLDAAGRQLQVDADGEAMLVTDGVFSMDGDVAPLAALAGLARTHDALLYVDDAHGAGVLGDEGRGSIAAAGLDVMDVPLRLVTLGKALGGYGAAVVGDADLVAHLAETARPYIYTTALSPLQAAASLEGVRQARRDQWRREHLQVLMVRFRTRAIQAGLPLLPSETPIQPVLVGGNADALALSAALEDAGYWVGAIRPPTVPEGSARLRITLTALHTCMQVDGLVDALSRAHDALGRGRIGMST